MRVRDLPTLVEKAVWDVLRVIAKLIDSIIAAIFGRSPGLASKVPTVSTKAEDVLKALAQEPTFSKLEVEYMLAHTPTSVLHDYASATKERRATIDLSALTPEQVDWIFQLSDADLEKLKAAGPAACEKALSGKKCGVVGLPLPRKSGEGHIYKEKDAEAPRYESKIARRIRQFKEDGFHPLQIAM